MMLDDSLQSFIKNVFENNGNGGLICIILQCHGMILSNFIEK